MIPLLSPRMAPKIAKPTNKSASLLLKSSAPSFMHDDGVEQEGLRKQRRDLLVEISEAQKEIDMLKKLIADKELVQVQEESFDIIVAEKTGDQDSASAQQKVVEFRPQIAKLQAEISNLESQIQDFQRNHSDDVLKKLKLEIAFQKRDISQHMDSIKQTRVKLEAERTALQASTADENKGEIQENSQRLNDLESILKDLQKDAKKIEEQCRRKREGIELREENESQLSALQQKYEALRKERIQKHQQIQKMTNDKATQKSMMRTCAGMRPNVEHSLYTCNPRKRRDPSSFSRSQSSTSAPPSPAQEEPQPEQKVERPRPERRVRFVFDFNDFIDEQENVAIEDNVVIDE